MFRKYSLHLNQVFKANFVFKNINTKTEHNLASRGSAPGMHLHRDVLWSMSSRTFHNSLPRCKREDRREMLASMPVPDEGTEGEKSIEVDSLVQREGDIYPDLNTFTTQFNGVPFKDIPICNVKVSKNNTIVSMCDTKGEVQVVRSCGMEGFKNTRKGTNVAAQATAISLGTKALERGFKTVRVRVKGIGPGRMSAIKGLQMSGLNIISVTDNTPVSWNPPRARKQRKL